MNQDEGGKQPKLAAGAKSDTEIATTFNNTDQGEPSPRLQSSVRGSLSLQITTDGACGASGEEKSALISGLVAQLKRRNITKTELLGRMQDLQRSPEATTTTADVPPESPPLLPADTPDHPHPRQMTAPPGDLSMAQSDQAPQISSTGSATAGGGGTAAAQAVGFFSANDRQAIIRRIADERRRRALVVMHSWSEGTPKSELLHTPSTDFSPSIVPQDSHAIDSPASHSSPRQNTPPSLSQAPSSARVPSYFSSGGTGQVGTATYRRTAWDHSSESAPIRSNETFTNNFPYPSHVSRTSRDHRVTEDHRSPQKTSKMPSNQTGLVPPAPEKQVPPLSSDCGGGNNVSGNGGISHRSTQHGNVRRRGSGPGSHSSEATRNLETYFNRRQVHGRQTRNDHDHEPRPDKDHHRDKYGPGISPICRRNTWPNEGRNGYENRQNFPVDVTQRCRFRALGEGSNGGGGGIGNIEDYAYDRRGKYGRFQRHEEYSTNRAVDGEAYHLRSFSEERARRGEELIRQELMSECTFKPKIKGLPQSYGATKNDDAPFLQRVNQWQKDKEKDAAARKADEQEKELELCTFAPRVNKASQRAALIRREALGENHIGVDERLYEESMKRDINRSHLLAEHTAKKEERLQNECPFKPSLSTKRASIATKDEVESKASGWNRAAPRGKSRYRQAAAAVAAAATATTGSGTAYTGGAVWGAGRRTRGGYEGGQEGHPEFDGCTFTPMVKGATKGMDQAQLYLQFDVVERLTGAAFRPSRNIDSDNDEGLGNGESRVLLAGVTGDGKMCSREMRACELSTLASTLETRGKSASDSSKGVPLRQRKGSSDRSSSFHAFLSRQNKLETDKLKHIECMQSMEHYSFQPEICPESIKIHQESNKGNFLQRVARDAAKKEHVAARKKAAEKYNPECTFKPKITARSSNRQGRSVVELSRGDQLKRETTLRLAKLRAEQEVLGDTTFQPRINQHSTSGTVVSKLKVASDPDDYIAKIETMQRRREEFIVKGAMEKALKELDGCTFRPKTTTCPKYITQIAKSISAAKASAPSKHVRRRPDWR